MKGVGTAALAVKEWCVVRGMKHLRALRLVFLASFAAVVGYELAWTSGREMFAVHLAVMGIAGGLFFDRLWPRVAIAAGIALVEFATKPFHSDAGFTILQWIVFYLVSEAIAGFVRNRAQARTNMLHVTTALAKSLDSRDEYTAHHSDNVARYAVRIAKTMGLPQRECEAIEIGGRLHDIGKIGIPESILTKPAKLTDEEYRVIQDHPVIGYETLKHISMFRRNGVLDMVRHHHERYDGTGYPCRLRGNEIPLAARILAAADALDAMLSRRTYRGGMTLQEAAAEIRRNRGKQFDPAVADALLDTLHRDPQLVTHCLLSFPRLSIHNKTS